MPIYDYECEKCGIMEIFHSITDDDWKICPECNESGLKKLISAGGAVIISGREANQYRDIKAARYWRDKNGVRHKVTEADGYTGSSTVKEQTASPDQVKARKKRAAKKRKQEGLQLQKNRADDFNRSQGIK